MKILGVSGSLRASSKNTTILESIPGVALFTGVADLPHFSPDLSEELAPVLVWREAIATADAVVVCSPEYAHGVPGSLKNALDWVVGTGEFSGKTVGVLNISPLSLHAHAQLCETLKTMDAHVLSGTISPNDHAALQIFFDALRDRKAPCA